MAGRLAAALAALLCFGVPLWWTLRANRPAAPPANRIDKACSETVSVPAQHSKRPALLDITDAVGLDFEPAVGPLGTYFMPEVNGAGGAMFDCDGDGDLDIYLINGGRSPHAVGEFPAGTRTESRLFRQEADGRFTDVTAGSGLENAGSYGIGCAVGDIDNDGDLDVYVTNYGPDRLYENQGDGRFVEVTEAAGIRDDEWGTCAAFFDYDRDGRLDLVVVNYTADPANGHSVGCTHSGGIVTYCGPRMFQPARPRLFHNEGVRTNANGGRTVFFADVTAAAGLNAALAGAGFGILCADLDGDGWQDFYVANDTFQNDLWINQRNGTFHEEGVLRGVAFNTRGEPQASMGVALGDANGDGAWDLLTTHISFEPGNLFLGDAAGTFSEKSDVTGLAKLTSLHTGWGVTFVDVDHDGDSDLMIVNGLVTSCRQLGPTDLSRTKVKARQEISDSARFWRDYRDRNLLLINRGTGVFDDGSAYGGDFCTHLGSARALVTGDVDNDGDVDFLVTYCGERARLFRNDFPKRGHWLKVRAVDPALNRDAFGAVVVVSTGERRQQRLIQSCGSYLAASDCVAHFGLGGAERYDAITVRWPDGMTEAFPGGAVDTTRRLERGQGTVTNEDPAP